MSKAVLTRSTVASAPASAGAQSPPARRVQLRPRWRDPRLVTGVALVAVSVVAGAVLMSSADDRVLVWSTSHDLATGTELQPDDLLQVPVNVTNGDVYLGANSSDLLGHRLTKPLAAGELVPVSAVASTNSALADRRLITIPVQPMHAPFDLNHGDRVDVYVSPRDSSGVAGTSQLVLGSALVSAVNLDSDSASGEIGVVLDVEAANGATVVSAGRGGVIDLVRVPVSSQ